MTDYITLINTATTLEQLNHIRFNSTDGWETLYFAGQIPYETMLTYFNATVTRWEWIVNHPVKTSNNIWLWIAGAALAILALKSKK